MIIIPAIDLIGGRCVRLTQGDYARSCEYATTPEQMVEQYVAHGMRRVHVVDLDGAKASCPQNLDVLRRLTQIEGAEIEWGGGIKTDEALDAVFAAGARYAVVGSVAAKQPEQFRHWLQRYGADRMVLGADVREGRVSVNGWLEDLQLTIDDLIAQFRPEGLSQVICTDISRDGMLQGPATELYVRLQQAFPDIAFTVSGGVSSLADLQQLQAAGLPRAIVGKAIYEGKIKLEELCSVNESSPAST